MVLTKNVRELTDLEACWIDACPQYYSSKLKLMLRALPLVVGLLLQSLRTLSAQSSGIEPQPPAPSLAATSSQAEPALVNVQSLLDAGKPNEAERAARSYLETHSSSADAHYLLGYILFREANPKASLAEYTEGGRYRAPSALDLEVIGCDYFLLEDYAAAGKWFTKAVDLDPTDAPARFYLGRAKFNEKHFDEAVSAFTACLKLNPKNVTAADHLGLSYQALNKTEDALRAYGTAIAADAGATPHDPGPYLNLGTLLVEIGRGTEAIPHLLQAVEMMPADPRAHRELGKAYLQLNRLEEAQIELGKAMDTPLQEARSLIEMGKLRAAEQLTRHYLEAHKDSADGHYMLGYILFKEEDPKSSLAEYTEGAKYRTPSAADLEAVAGNYVLLKDYPDADKWFTKAVEWNPNDALGWYYLGRTKYNENRFEEAVSAFQNAWRWIPGT